MAPYMYMYVHVPYTLILFLNVYKVDYTCTCIFAGGQAVTQVPVCRTTVEVHVLLVLLIFVIDSYMHMYMYEQILHTLTP